MTKRICYYQVLSVDEDVSAEDLKKAYKKSALRWHPDKNLGDEDAHIQFLAVKEAYTVLSDPHERAWYDKHKDQILSGGTEEISCFNVFPYFTSSCYSGYNDDDFGFYTVYRKVFENIVGEDEAVVGKGKISAPSFGGSESSFPDIVEPFYNYWSQYCTKITFAWADEKIAREYGRKAVKLIQKENLKKRDKLKKERNEEVRNLVTFVKKRDRRVTAWREKMEEEKKEKELQLEESRRVQLLEKKRQNEEYEECEWSKFSAIENQLENLEKTINATFNESDSDHDSEHEGTKIKSLYCVACRKYFQSEKAFGNHEGSKKHKQNVVNLDNGE